MVGDRGLAIRDKRDLESRPDASLRVGESRVRERKQTPKMSHAVLSPLLPDIILTKLYNL